MSEATSHSAGWRPATYYPDPAIQALDPRFEKYWLKLSAVERLTTGLRWAEGPVWFGDGRYLLCSDIPNQRILKWEEETGHVSIFRKPSNFAKLPIDAGLIHHASDTPYTQARTLGARGLSYYGMDSTYASSLAILRRILSQEDVLED